MTKSRQVSSHAAEGVEGWRVLGDGACTYFSTGAFTAGARLVQAISGIPRHLRAPPRR